MPLPNYPVPYNVEQLIPTKIRTQYFEEYIGLTPLTAFMGTSSDDIIQMYELNSGDGWSHRVPFRKELDYTNPMVGFNQLRGSEQQLTFFYDEISLNLLRQADSIMGVPALNIMTPVQILEALRPSLLNVQQRNLVKSLFDAATINLIGTWDSTTATNGPIASRVVYGNNRFNATFVTVLTAVGGGTAGPGTDAAPGDGLSVRQIRRLKLLATQGGASFELEPRIKPYILRNKRGFPEEVYVLLIDPASYLSLAADPAWQQYFNRGIVLSDQPEALSGSRFRGMIEGVMVYECPELSRYQQTNNTVAWNLFCGAQALGLTWGRRPWFETETSDYNLNKSMAVCEIRGQKAFQFPSYSVATAKIERGIIHSFTKIA